VSGSFDWLPAAVSGKNFGVGDVRWISVDELFRQYLETVQLVAADAATQLAWMDRWRVPSDEIRLQLDDAVFSFEDRLLKAKRLTSADVLAVAAIRAEFDSWDEVALWRSREALAERTEWKQVRRIAQDALKVLQSPES
jgi:hypothetical protein